MAYLDLNTQFGLGHKEFSDVFQTEAGTTIGYTRKNLALTATAGTTIEIGTILQDNGDGTASIPATTAEITDPVIYCGDDPYRQQAAGKRDWNPNTTVFTADNLAKDVFVVYRGRVGVAKAYLVFPSDATATTKQAVYDLLDAKGFKIIRQVAKY